MKILVQFRETLNAAFQDLTEKRSNRMQFFTLYVLIFSIFSGIASYITIKAIFIVDEPSFYQYRDVGWQGTLSMISQSGAIAGLVMIFLMRYYKTNTAGRMGKYSLGDLFNKMGGAEWAFFILGIMVTLTCSYYFGYDRGGYYGPSYSSLDGVLANVGLNGGSYFDHWIESVINYIISYLPLLFLGTYLLWLMYGKISFNLIGKHWRNYMTLIIAFIAFTGAYEAITRIISEMLIGVLIIPLQEFYIVIIISVVIFLIMAGFYYAVLSKVLYYSFFAEVEQDVDPLEIGDDEDLLDQ